MIWRFGRNITHCVTAESLALFSNTYITDDNTMCYVYGKNGYRERERENDSNYKKYITRFVRVKQRIRVNTRPHADFGIL